MTRAESYHAKFCELVRDEGIEHNAAGSVVLAMAIGDLVDAVSLGEADSAGVRLIQTIEDLSQALRSKE